MLFKFAVGTYCADNLMHSFTFISCSLRNLSTTLQSSFWKHFSCRGFMRKSFQISIKVLDTLGLCQSTTELHINTQGLLSYWQHLAIDDTWQISVKFFDKILRNDLAQLYLSSVNLYCDTIGIKEHSALSSFGQQFRQPRCMIKIC
jgi:hypothetical protein